MPTMWVLQDIHTGLYFNRQDYRSHGAWMTTTFWSPTWATEDAALAAGRADGMLVGTFRAVQLQPGVGGFYGWEDDPRVCRDCGRTITGREDDCRCAEDE